MNKHLLTFLRSGIFGALCILASSIDLTAAQKPNPAADIKSDPTQEIQPEQDQITTKQVDFEWLNYISTAALVPPLPNHSGIITEINILHPNDLTAILRFFVYQTLTELSRAGINTEKEPNSEFPHARKLLVNPHDEIYFVGDIHGSIGALARLMWLWRNMGLLDENFKIPDGKYLVFLGDYVDYGKEGLSVLYTLLNLKLHNWNRMILLRGNHESAQLSSYFGFCKELIQKYGPDLGKYLHSTCSSACFGILPSVLYIGIDKHHSFMQCCHGGIEPGFNPKAFLESDAMVYDLTDTFEHYKLDDELMTVIEPDLDKRNNLKASLIKEMASKGLLAPNQNGYRYTSAALSGFQWSDATTQAPFGFNASRGCGFMASKEIMSEIGRACKICAYVRGHQHNHGIKIGDMEKKGNAEDARWYKIFGLQQQPASVEFRFSTPLVLNMNTLHTYPALLKIVQLLEQQPIPLQEYTAAWQEFKNSLPSFKFSTFTDLLPIITLTSASEAAAENHVNNPWDGFGLCTIGNTIENSDCALYEAEASAPRQSSRDHLMTWAQQQQQWSKNFKLPVKKADEEKKT